MSSTIISLIQPPNIDLSQAPTAFGRWAVPRVARELQSPFLLRRQRALRALHDHLQWPEHVGLCYEAGLLDIVHTLYAGENDPIERERCVACILQFMQDERARAALFENDRKASPLLIASAYVVPPPPPSSSSGSTNLMIIDTLLARIDDAVERVRMCTHRILLRLSSYAAGALNLLQNGNRIKSLPVRLVELLDNEDTNKNALAIQIQCLILDCMHNLMQWNTYRFIVDASAVSVLVGFCQHADADIRRRAMRCAGDVAMPRNGKQEAVQRGLVEVLMDTITKNNDANDNDIRASALFALAMLTILTDGKYRALKANALPVLAAYLTTSDVVVAQQDEEAYVSEIKLNAMKVLTCLGETPDGRKAMLEEKFYDIILKLQDDRNNHIRLAIDKLQRVIKWKP